MYINFSKIARTYFNDMTDIIGKYRTMRSCLAIVFYGELFSIYDKVMASFILDKDELNLWLLIYISYRLF